MVRLKFRASKAQAVTGPLFTGPVMKKMGKKYIASVKAGQSGGVANPSTPCMEYTCLHGPLANAPVPWSVRGKGSETSQIVAR